MTRASIHVEPRGPTAMARHYMRDLRLLECHDWMDSPARSRLDPDVRILGRALPVRESVAPNLRRLQRVPRVGLGARAPDDDCGANVGRILASHRPVARVGKNPRDAQNPPVLRFSADHFLEKSSLNPGTRVALHAATIVSVAGILQRGRHGAPACCPVPDRAHLWPVPSFPGVARDGNRRSFFGAGRHRA